MNGIDRIAEERRRQITVYGWLDAHDDEHIYGELPRAAACYALSVAGIKDDLTYQLWPWLAHWDKRPNPGASLKERRRAAEKAGALLAAEIDRLTRLIGD
jgi:hypothetical protein